MLQIWNLFLQQLSGHATYRCSRHRVPVYTHSAEAYQVDGGQQYSHYSHDTLDDIAQLQQLSGSHALAQLESAADNIDSWVQQLSISSGGLKGSYSDDIPTIHDDFDDFSHGLADIHGLENWWYSSLRVGITFQDGDRFNSCQVIYSQFDLAIHQNDHQARRRFVEWAQNEIAVVPDFHKRILFSDEAHFWLNGYVNKQNCRIWSEANSQVAMITNFFIPELNNQDVQELWFQQDGATCHTARATIDLLKDTFGDRLISRFGPVNWPSRSFDLTPLDYFLWDYVKSLVYADKPQTLDHLEDNIRRVIADIRPQISIPLKKTPFIEGTEITVASDHQPLKWLLKLKSLTGRLARWALEIQSSNLKVQYIPGKANVVADMLSRPVTQEEETFCEANNITIADMPTRSCVLYRYVPDADSAEAQLVIPNAERELIMQRHNNDPMAGHYGEDGTFQKIAKRYYWTGMKKYISDYIKKCPECVRFKAINQKPAGLLRTRLLTEI
ncbi:uncharacterized protein TNCV_5072531 [Trichonephila clavipes]|nr:uncharacterized protein TNCV_5072531 [Trichonephila clavipes]